MLGPWYVGDTPATDIEIHIQRDGVDVIISNYTAAEVLLFDIDGNAVEWNGEATLDTEENAVIVPPPATSPFAAKGVYSLYIRLTSVAGGTETSFADIIQVLAIGSQDSWATIGQVYSLTGQVVTLSNVLDAQEVVEIHCGRTFESTDLFKARDIVWLRKAVAYQAIWMPLQPGYFERHTIKETIQDGAQVVFAGSNEPANTGLFMLAPLAMRALKNLSWMGSTSIKFRRPRFGPRPLSASEYRYNDDHEGWRPL